MRLIDSILDYITMYQLVLYEVLFLLGAAFCLSIVGFLPFGPLLLLESVAYLFVVSLFFNYLFEWAFDAPSNPESTYITALILALIINPPLAFIDANYFALAGWAAAVAIASKYILALGKKHIFNPAAFGAASTAIFLGLSASWWVGTASMLPFVIVGGYLVLRKIQRFGLFWSFVALATVLVIGHTAALGGSILTSFGHLALTTPLFFLGTVMLTEPMTTPPTKMEQIFYGALVGILFVPFIHFGPLYTTPELALLIANIYSYIVSPKRKLVLTLKDRVRLTRDTFEFIFTSDRPLSFVAGQYLEWTLAHKRPDLRGIRRYFTIASSPTERDIHLGVKFYGDSSTFKKKLLSLKRGDTISAGQLAGDFVLPKDKKKKLVFIAGGIGITPFRSQIQELLDKQEHRPITLFYGNKTAADIAYHKLLERAEREIGLKTVYSFSDEGAIPPHMPRAIGLITGEAIRTNVPDYKERMFYLSGPQVMVNLFEDTLRTMGVRHNHIKTDFFPGFA